MRSTISGLVILTLTVSAIASASTPKPDKPDLEESGPPVVVDQYFNRSGATFADYRTDWQACRLIARGSRVAGPTYYYVPPSYSPVAAGVGAGIGAAIAVMIIEGQMRRANRMTCLLIRGWHEMKLSPTEVKTMAALTDTERETRRADAIGSADPKLGSVIRAWHNDYALAPEAAK